MNNSKLISLIVFTISAIIICFEIISTRISSVIFVQNYAFIVLSLAILGLGGGGVFFYYKTTKKTDNDSFYKGLSSYLVLAGASLILFITTITVLGITNPFVYFFLLFFPFFFLGMAYSLIFKTYSNKSFKIYASDLTGAATGAVISLLVFYLFNAPNAVLFLAIILFGCAISHVKSSLSKNRLIGLSGVLIVLATILIVFGKRDLVGNVPIGKYLEKDFYYVYEGMDVESNIIESKWSVNGRADLVEYGFQDQVKQLFVDGAAGSPMYRFNGNIANHDKIINKLLLEFTTSIPFLFLPDNEKNNMLVIGPGGGKEILSGLLGGVKKITGVEVNSDFIEIVKKYKDYNGGIYTNFPNVNIIEAEGRHFVKQSTNNWDIILLALPSTKQLQSINNFAANENFLLTQEAIKDYLKVLTDKGQLIFTVHNRWELVRLMVTSIYAFNELGINAENAMNHFIVLGADYEPTIVIKKNAFSEDSIERIEKVLQILPKNFPKVTYLPYRWDKIESTAENNFLKDIKEGRLSLESYISNYKYDISPVRDDSPYFYKVFRGVPDDYLNLFIAIIVLCIAVIVIPLIKIKDIKKNISQRKLLYNPLMIFILTGFGFMIIEVSLFQKLILFLGVPTISLAVLLASLLVGMGIGSYTGGKILGNNPHKRIAIIAFAITVVGLVLFWYEQKFLTDMIVYGQFYRSLICFLLLVPFGFLLGIPFPTGIQILKQVGLDNFIPWLYGVNGMLTVLGSVTAVILSMLFGFTFTFTAGLAVYFILFLMFCKYLFKAENKISL
jgi:hypothetical protein